MLDWSNSSGHSDSALLQLLLMWLLMWVWLQVSFCGKTADWATTSASIRGQCGHGCLPGAAGCCRLGESGRTEVFSRSDTWLWTKSSPNRYEQICISCRADSFLVKTTPPCTSLLTCASVLAEARSLCPWLLCLLSVTPVCSSSSRAQRPSSPSSMSFTLASKSSWTWRSRSSEPVLSDGSVP